MSEEVRRNNAIALGHEYEETIFPARIAEIIDRKNETILALVVLFSLIFLARIHNTHPQTRQNSLDTDDLARLQILKDTAARLLKRHKRKSKVRRLDDYSEDFRKS